jgi:hypothetical protein
LAPAHLKGQLLCAVAAQGRRLLIPVMALTLLPLSGIPKASHQVEKRLICGRVVDERGNPVTGALVTLAPATLNPKWGADILLPGALSEKDGAFCIESFERETKDADARLYVTATCRTGDLTLVDPPFESLPSRPSAFTGKLVNLKTDRTDVGDINLQVIYPHVTLRILDRGGRPLLTQREQWSPVWLRVKDQRGTVVKEGGLSSGQIESAVDVTRSSINLALPQGVWRIEVALEGIPPNVSGVPPRGRWIRVPRSLVVSSCQKPTDVSLIVGKPAAKHGRNRSSNRRHI